jgi:hypothetical protein
MPRNSVLPLLMVARSPDEIQLVFQKRSDGDFLRHVKDRELASLPVSSAHAVNLSHLAVVLSNIVERQFICFGGVSESVVFN